MAKSTAAIPFLFAAATWLYLGIMRQDSTCRPEYKNKPTHTACKPPSPWCQVFTAGVSAAEIDEILKLHNDYRSQVAQGRLEGYPKAADMLELNWDYGLAEVAQAHANLCKRQTERLEHDKAEERSTPVFELTGQNLAWSAQSEPVKEANWTFAISEWFVEYKDYSPKDVAKFVYTTHVATGHFTQVIWAATQYVGCGYVYYTHNGATIPHMRKYTCNYGPGGNILQRPIYREGDTCSACPNSTVCSKSTGLCTPEYVRGGIYDPFAILFSLFMLAMLAFCCCFPAYLCWRLATRASNPQMPPEEQPAGGTTGTTGTTTQ